MDIKLLVLHRKEQYDGEHAPEILAVVDEWTLEENPEWWADEVKKQKDLIGDDAQAWAEVTVWLSDGDIRDALYPEVQGDVTGE